MKRCISTLSAGAAFIVAGVLGCGQSHAQYAYITNNNGNSVSVINTAGNTVKTTIQVGRHPYGVAVAPDGSAAYVTNSTDDTVSVIDTMSNTVSHTLPVGGTPRGLAFTPDGQYVYVANEYDDSLSLIATATKRVFTIPLPRDRCQNPTRIQPHGVAVAPDGTKVYIANKGEDDPFENSPRTVSVIDRATNTVATTIELPAGGGRGSGPAAVAFSPDGGAAYVTNPSSRSAPVAVIDTATDTLRGGLGISLSPAGGLALSPDSSKIYATSGHSVVVIDRNGFSSVQIPVGFNPVGLSVTSDGSKVYVANSADNTVSVIDATKNAVTATIPVGAHPIAFGQFIGPTAAGMMVQSAPPSGSLCSGPYDGAIKGDLTVSEGQDCRIVDGGQVTGNVKVAGGNFVLSSAAVGGSVTVEGGSFTIGPGATVSGDVVVENLPAGGDGNSICGSTVEGSLRIDGNASTVQIGSSAPLVCPGNAIGGDVVVDGNSASALVFANQVAGALQADNNTGPLDVVGNTVGGTLQCQNNTTLIMGGLNGAAQKTGQCH
jgi:YVTN family beta-propeller protein